MSMDSKFDQPYDLVMKAVAIFAPDKEATRAKLCIMAKDIIFKAVHEEVDRHDDTCTCMLCWAIAVLDAEKEEKC